MDAGRRSTRKYPSYTTAQLEAFVAAGEGNETMVAEIAARKAGASANFSTPQIAGGMVRTIVGRM
jgi:hypothetical protein